MLDRQHVVVAPGRGGVVEGVGVVGVYVAGEGDGELPDGGGGYAGGGRGLVGGFEGWGGDGGMGEGRGRGEGWR